MRRITVLALILLSSSVAHARDPISIILPDADNLQDLPLFVAIGAGYFADAGLDVTLKVSPTPGEVVQMLHADAEQVAVLPPPLYLQLIADRFPLRVVANLLQNDAINLVVRRSWVAAQHLPIGAGVGERLRALAGVRLGVAPGPITRLRVLYRSQGLDADTFVKIVPLMGQEQNEAFAAQRVDALYAHTPYLERALVEQDAVLYVNQSAGEVPALAGRMIHALVVTVPMAQRKPLIVRRLVNAIARAEELVHRDAAATQAAIARALPDRAPALIERVVSLYRPAVPRTPAVTVEGVRAAVVFFPASKRAPDLSRVDFAEYVDDRFARKTRAR
jgi:ABC-type nitrate/sulfonate/bicarbonate transport system substrate-binding protein